MQLATRYGRAFPFVLVAVVLAVYGMVAALLLRDAPGRTVPTGSFLTRTWATLRMRATLQLSALYAVGFGGFVAFSVYLPTYLKNAYGLTQSDAALRTAGFVVLAVLMRPVGGWLSDRFHPVPVLTVCFAAAAALAVLAAARFPLLPPGTVAFLGLAAVLGARVRCDLRARRPRRARGEGRRRHRRGRRRGRPRRVRPAAGDGCPLRRDGRLRHRPAAARAGRADRRGLHLAGPAPRTPARPREGRP